jgi:hypothetical protein
MSLINHTDEGPNHGGKLNDLSYFKEFKTLDVFGKTFSISYKNRKTFNSLDAFFTITQLENLELVSSDEPSSEIYIDEDVVVIPIAGSEIGYFHLIYNVLSEIEIIKSMFPKVKIKILNLCDKEIFKFLIEKFKKTDTFKVYGIEDSDIINFEENDFIKIKSLFFIYTQFNPIASKIASHNFDYSGDRKGKKLVWSYLIEKPVRDRFLINDQIINDRKIFLSGMKSNNIKRATANLIYKRVFGHSMSLKETKTLIGLRVENYQDFVDRLMTESEELKLEKMFKEAGYEIIDPENLKSIYDQAALFASASHVVGLAGASFINSIFCKKDTQILILNSSDSYSFPHKEIVASFGLDVKTSPRQKPWRDYTYSAEMIFNLVKRDFPSFLPPVL